MEKEIVYARLRGKGETQKDIKRRRVKLRKLVKQFDCESDACVIRRLLDNA